MDGKSPYMAELNKHVEGKRDPSIIEGYEPKEETSAVNEPSMATLAVCIAVLIALISLFFVGMCSGRLM